jgi:hypothetical protein
MGKTHTEKSRHIQEPEFQNVGESQGETPEDGTTR